MNKLKELKEYIQKEIPEILELKFGDYIQIPKNSGEMYCYRAVDIFESNAFEDLKPQTYKGNVCHKETEKIVLARNQAITDDVLERFAVKDIEIIGRQITLEDVLRVIHRIGGTVAICKSCDGCIEDEMILEKWELGQPLDNQTEETILFLCDVLGVEIK